MKTHVLTVSRTFPQTHKRAGEETYFIKSIFDGTKIHTIRANYELWAKRINEVKEDKAILSLRFWSAKPYHSNQVEFLKLTKDNNVDVQKLDFFEDKDGACSYKYPLVNNYSCPLISEISANDGLSLEDFKEWFKKYDLSNPMAIIHFTSKRY